VTMQVAFYLYSDIGAGFSFLGVGGVGDFGVRICKPRMWSFRKLYKW